MSAFSAHERDVLQLLRLYRVFETPGGGALPVEDSHLRTADYGPAGYTESGGAFDKEDRALLRKSLKALKGAMLAQSLDDFPAPLLYQSLIDPYLSDEADHTIVGRWRETGSRKAGWHDDAIRDLARRLRGVTLHPIYPRLKSDREQAADEKGNAEIYAVYQRCKVNGRSHRLAVLDAATLFGVSADTIERIIEFRSDLKLASCAEPDCQRTVFSQNLCEKHYRRAYRERKKNGPRKAC